MTLGGFLTALAVIIFICIFLNKLSMKVGVPVLLFFILLGMAVGVFQDLSVEECGFVERFCTFDLIFIMFYGGFGTRWKSARPVAVESGVLATLGVFMTAALVGLFCHYALQWTWSEGFLMGAVISSTDAASVFSILRTRKMGLKNNSAPLIEMESGSNDPCSNLLTIVMISVITGTADGGQVAWMVIAQFVFGAAIGLIIAQGAAFVLRRVRFDNGFDSLFIFSVAIFAYAVPTLVGGNGYLSTYIVGIVLGNTQFRGRKSMVHFFDGVTSLMQILIFFMLGYMANHMSVFKAALPALLIFLFITFVARPVAVSSILAPFRKYKPNQIGLISFVGLRGAASIVFAIMTLTGDLHLENDIFSTVFFIVLVSISIQGSLIPQAAKLFGMKDDSVDVMSTFTDYSESDDVNFVRLNIHEDGPWCNKMIKDLLIPDGCLVTVVIRDGKKIVPKGNTALKDGDIAVLCFKSFHSDSEGCLHEHPVSKNSKWIGKRIMDHPEEKSLVVMIRRGNECIIPNGQTVFEKGDVLVIMDQKFSN